MTRNVPNKVILKVLCSEVIAWRVHQDLRLYNVDKTFPKGEVLRCFAINNRSDRVYRNTWCNAGRQRTRRCTKDTFWNPYRIWRETTERGLLYRPGEPRSQFFWWRHGWGDTPYPHLTSWYVTSRGLIWTIFKGRLPWGDSQSDPELKRESRRSKEKKPWRWVDLCS